MNQGRPSRTTLIGAIAQAQSPRELLGLIEKAERLVINRENVRTFLLPEAAAATPGPSGGARDHILAVTMQKVWIKQNRDELFRHAAVLVSRDSRLPSVPNPSDDPAVDLSVRLRQWCVDAEKAQTAVSLPAAEPVVEPKPIGRDSLAAEVKRPANIQRLFDAINWAASMSSQLAYANNECVKLEAEGTRPGLLDWPDRADERKQAFVAWLDSQPNITSEERERHLAGKDWDTTWSRALIDLKTAYEQWDSAMDAAIEAAPGAADIMDAGEPRLPERWTTKCLGELRELKGLLTPVVWGNDGMGLARRQCRPLPERFGELVALLERRLLTLMDVRETAPPDDAEADVAPGSEQSPKPRRKWTAKRAAKAAKGYLKRHPNFPGIRPLARAIGCKHTTLSDGIDADAELAGLCSKLAKPDRQSPVTGQAAGDAVEAIKAKPEEEPAFERADNMIDHLINDVPSRQRERVREVYRANKAAIDQMALMAVEKGDLETVQMAQESIRDLLLGGCSPNS